MKIVKLDRRFNARKEGFTCSLRFDYPYSFNDDILPIEMFLYRSTLRVGKDWQWRYAKLNKMHTRTYWIDLLDESYVSWLILNNVIEAIYNEN